MNKSKFVVDDFNNLKRLMLKKKKEFLHENGNDETVMQSVVRVLS